MGFPGGSVVNNPPANTGDTGLISGLGRSSGEGNGDPLQYSGLGSPMDSPWGCKRIGHDLATEHVYMHSPRRYLYLLSYFFLYLLSYFIHPGAPKCVFSKQDFGLSSPDFAFEMKHSLTSQWHKH